MGAFAHHLPGHTLLATFIDEVERGLIPRIKTTKVIVQAFRAILAGEDPDVALRLRRSRGKKFPTSLGELEEKNQKVLRYVEQKIDAHETHTDREYRQARKLAIAAAADSFGVDTRTIERAWATHESHYKMMRQWRAALDVIDKNLTPAEKRRMQKKPLPQVYAYAQRKTATKSKTGK